MYYEPTKKTTYRFPSVNKFTDFDTRYYFPEKRDSSVEDSRSELSFSHHSSEKEIFYDV